MDWMKFDIENYIDSKEDKILNESQKCSLRVLNHQLKNHGAIIADEVGTGKTRIACGLIDHITKNNLGRVAVVIPSGLVSQWQKELNFFTKEKPVIIRSYLDLIFAFEAITKTNAPIFISQTFQYSNVRSTEQEWRYVFLALFLFFKKEDQSFESFRNFAMVSKTGERGKSGWSSDGSPVPQITSESPAAR